MLKEKVRTGANRKLENKHTHTHFSCHAKYFSSIEHTRKGQPQRREKHTAELAHKELACGVMRNNAWELKHTLTHTHNIRSYAQHADANLKCTLQPHDRHMTCTHRHFAHVY